MNATLEKPHFAIGQLTMYGKIVGVEHGLNRNSFVKKAINDWVYLVQPQDNPHTYQEYSQTELLNLNVSSKSKEK